MKYQRLKYDEVETANMFFINIVASDFTSWFMMIAFDVFILIPGCYVELTVEGLIARNQRSTEFGPRDANENQSFQFEKCAISNSSGIVDGDKV